MKLKDLLFEAPADDDMKAAKKIIYITKYFFFMGGQVQAKQL